MSIKVPLCNSSALQLRFLSPDDQPEIKTLCADWFPIEYPDNWYKEITSNPKFFSLAAIFNYRIIGLVVAEVKTRFKCNREDLDILSSHFPSSIQIAYILSLGVVKDFRRNGIASLLLENLLQYLTATDRYNCKAVYLHVLTTNVSAIRFYERRNFKLHNYLPYYYSIKGVAKDGFSYVLYINGGQPPWTILDYIKHFQSLVLKIQPCAIPQRLAQGIQSLLRKFFSGMSHISITNSSSNHITHGL